jgi:hypothetical protein
MSQKGEFYLTITDCKAIDIIINFEKYGFDPSILVALYEQMSIFL